MLKIHFLCFYNSYVHEYIIRIFYAYAETSFVESIDVLMKCLHWRASEASEAPH